MLYSWGSWSTERVSDLSKVTERRSSQTRTRKGPGLPGHTKRCSPSYVFNGSLLSTHCYPRHCAKPPVSKLRWVTGVSLSHWGDGHIYKIRTENSDRLARQSAWAAGTEHHRWGWRPFPYYDLLTVLEAAKFQSRVPASWVSGEGPLPGPVDGCPLAMSSRGSFSVWASGLHQGPNFIRFVTQPYELI